MDVLLFMLQKAETAHFCWEKGVNITAVENSVESVKNPVVWAFFGR